MTQIPSPVPDEPISDAPPRPRITLALAVSWFIVIASVVLIVVLSQLEPAPEAADEWSGSTRLSVSVSGRYIVGVKAAFGNSPLARDIDFMQQMKQLDAMPHPPTAKLRLVIVAGELLDGDEALQRLEPLVFSGETAKVDAAAGAALSKLYREGTESLSPEETGAIRKLEWFGELALTHGMDDASPRRAAVLAVAMKTMVILVVVALIGLLALLVGLVLLIVALVLRLHGKLKSQFTPPSFDVGAKVFESVAVWFAAMISLGFLARWLSKEYELNLGWGVYGLVLLTPFWPLVRGVSWAELRQAMGWHAGRGVWREAVAGIAGYLAGLPILLIAMFVTLLLMKLLESTPSHPISDWVFGGGAWSRVALIVLAAVWAPVMEESIFRGAMYQHLRGWLGIALGVLVTGFIFAIIHPQGFAALPVLTAMGGNFAVLREWRGSLIAPMVAHGFNNAIVTTLLLMVLG